MLHLDLENDAIKCEGFMTNDERKNQLAWNINHMEEYPKIANRIVKEVMRE
jgi:hypothetical protein